MTALAHRDLAQCEEVIGRGLHTFVEVAQALMEIRDRRLYRLTHHTFENYCRERWDFSDSRGRQLMGAVETVTAVTVFGLAAPTNERQVRALAPLRNDPQKMAEAWSEALVTTNGHPTPAAIAEAVEKRIPQRQLTKAEQIEEDRQGAIRRGIERLEALVVGWIELIALPENPERKALLKGLIDHDRQIVQEIEAMYLEAR